MVGPLTSEVTVRLLSLYEALTVIVAFSALRKVVTVAVAVV
jgi:hypothetical protein